jgi:cytosine/adenosine deaminase-related metal-dependent hydrolase
MRRLITAAAVADASGILASPGGVLVEGHCVLGVGPISEFEGLDGFEREDLGSSLLMPGLVNLHAHLDLSHIGPVPFNGDFVSWVDLVRAQRVEDEASLAASIDLGVAYALAGGTVAVGDIAGLGRAVVAQQLLGSGLLGVSYIEVFGHGSHAQAAVDMLSTRINSSATSSAVPVSNVSGSGSREPYAAGMKLGAQPHAPYSCGLSVYEAAAQLRVPMATHLSETRAELDFVARAQGPFAELLHRLGKWDQSIEPQNCHPVESLSSVLSWAPCVVAHVNYLDKHACDLLARWPVTVAYCPRASAYFGHPDGQPENHPYRQLLERGVRVGLGTDSLLCLDTPNRISILDEMRFLWRRDGIEPVRLLQMATVNGAMGLHLDPSLVLLNKGPVAGLIAIPGVEHSGQEALRDVLASDEQPVWALPPKNADIDGSLRLVSQ